MASVKKKIIFLKSRSVGMTSMASTLMSYYLAQSLKEPRDDIDDSMGLSLEKINPQFRQQVDQLFFSDRMDLDLSDFKSLLRENYTIHFEYLWDRFFKGSAIHWENGSEFWANRFSFLLSLNDKSLPEKLESLLEKRFYEAVRTKHNLDIRYNFEYLQFLEFCKVKSERKENLAPIKAYLTDLPATITVDKLTKIVESFIPIVFSSIDEYVEAISKRILISARNFDFLIALEKKGVAFNKAPLIQLTKSILMERLHNEKNRRAFLTLISNQSIRDALKQEYKPECRDKLLHLINHCEYQMLEEFHLRNIKNLIDLDETVADELAVIYADKLYQRTTGHKRANADRLIRLLNQCPQIVPKKILAYLSAKNKMSDIKYVLNSFPNLKKLAAFM